MLNLLSLINWIDDKMIHWFILIYYLLILPRYPRQLARIHFDAQPLFQTCQSSNCMCLLYWIVHTLRALSREGNARSRSLAAAHEGIYVIFSLIIPKTIDSSFTTLLLVYEYLLFSLLLSTTKTHRTCPILPHSALLPHAAACPIFPLHVCFLLPSIKAYLTFILAFILTCFHTYLPSYLHTYIHSFTHYFSTLRFYFSTV